MVIGAGAGVGGSEVGVGGSGVGVGCNGVAVGSAVGTAQPLSNVNKQRTAKEASNTLMFTIQKIHLLTASSGRCWKTHVMVSL